MFEGHAPIRRGALNRRHAHMAVQELGQSKAADRGLEARHAHPSEER